MKNRIYAIVLISLVYFFPFRWVFVETPDCEKVFNTYVDGGGLPSAIYMLIVILGMLGFMALMFRANDQKGETS